MTGLRSLPRSFQGIVLAVPVRSLRLLRSLRPAIPPPSRVATVPHSGFGMGIERALTWITGIEHLRETIPFPRLLNRLRP